MKVFIIIWIWVTVQKSIAQPTLPLFKPLRYQEEYAFLKDDTLPSTYKRIKYIRLSPAGDAYLSFGGDIRYQYFNIQNEDWGSSSKDKDGFVLSRFLIHSDVHLSAQVRTFVQLQGSMANNKASGTSAVDENPLDLHQAFIDINNTSKSIVFRIGRQEFSYGSQRLIAVRELPNNRQAFDGAKLIFQNKRWQLDAFYSRYVVAKKGLFDDASNRDIQLWGGYATVNHLFVFAHADVYYLGLRRKRAAFDDGEGEELRHSIGWRVWNQRNNWRYDLEGVYQFGSFANKTTRAWTASANLGYRLSTAPLQPEFGFKTELISGDRKKDDDRLQTFNPLFPRGAYFGLAALIGPANLFDVHPSIEMNLWKKRMLWSVDYDAFWRHSTNDGIYAPTTMLLYPTGSSTTRFIGHQLASDVTITPNPFLLLRMEGTWFKPGPYLKDVSPGEPILFFGITSQLKF